MSEKYSKYSAWAIINTATGTCHFEGKAPDVTEGSIAKVHFIEGEANTQEASSSTLVELTDGRFLFATEWGDCTGHGCQCSGHVEFFDTLEDAVDCGLDFNQRSLYRASFKGADSEVSEL